MNTKDEHISPSTRAIDLFNATLTPKQAAEKLGLSEGTVKNRCAAGELFCKKVGKQWILSAEYLESTMPVEIWESWNDNAYLVDVDDIELYHAPVIDKAAYFEIHEEELEDRYGYLDEPFTIDDVNWDKEQEYYGHTENLVRVSRFTDEYAKQQGFLPRTEEDESFRVWEPYADVQFWEENVEVTAKLIISKESVSLDEWDGRNFVTGGVGFHQCVYRILSSQGIPDYDYLVVHHSNWSGDHDQVELYGNLDDVLKHIDELGNRDREEYKEKLLEL